MTPRQRVETALRGDLPDVIPFSIYANKLPRCQVELELRNAGACILERSPGALSVETPNVKATTVQTQENGATIIRTTYETPAGPLTTVNRPAPGTTWQLKRMFGGPDDYKALIAFVRDRQWRENYDAFAKARERYGDGSFLRANFGYSPLQEILYSFMGVEQFSIEWAERRDDLMKLYDALTENHRKAYQLMADSPAMAVNYGGNVSPEIMGIDRFRRYILPHYEEAAEILHRKGKLIGVHFDANNLALADAIAESSLDYVEAFTPPPDCDMSVAEARRRWPDKVLWINFPSSVHHDGVSAVEELMRQILREAAPGNGFLVGITEDVPDYAWPETFPAIARVINDVGRIPISLAC